MVPSEAESLSVSKSNPPSAAAPPGPAQASSLIKGVYTVPLKVFGDTRGYFFETFRRSWIPEAREMIQGNCSFSSAGVLRGLHYHLKQADLWNVPVGLVRAVLYDFRAASPTRGAAEIIEMGESNRVALYIPKGVAHGFLAVRDSYMTYLVDEFYDNSDELGILWSDPALKVDWSLSGAPSLSDRDQQNPRIADIPVERRPP
jgi:dTDP-4-dehydrorhamnose 3,5-epimerase